jgi:hypothetical protein
VSDVEFPVYVSSAGAQLRCIYLTAQHLVRDIKRRVQDLEGLPMSQQVVLLYGQPLPDDSTLAECGVGEQTHLRVVTAAAAAAAAASAGGGAASATGASNRANAMLLSSSGASSLLTGATSTGSAPLNGSGPHAIDVDSDTSKRRTGSSRIVDLQHVKVGVCLATLLALFYAIVGPVFDDDPDNGYGEDFVRYFAQVWKFVIVGAGAGAVYSAAAGLGRS